MTIKSSNQLPAVLLASFPCKLNTFRKSVKNVVTSKGIQAGIECKKVKLWEVKWCGVNWRDLCEVILFWSEVSYGEVLGDKNILHIRVTLNWGYFIVLWLFHLVCILYCGCFNLFGNVRVSVCGSVLTTVCVLW